MLIVSHTGMAVEAVLFARFFTYGRIGLLLVSIWTIANDIVDYTWNVFPWLPRELHGDLPRIRLFTMGMSLLSIGIAAWLAAVRPRRTKPDDLVK